MYAFSHPGDGNDPASGAVLNAYVAAAKALAAATQITHHVVQEYVNHNLAYDALAIFPAGSPIPDETDEFLYVAEVTPDGGVTYCQGHGFEPITHPEGVDD